MHITGTVVNIEKLSGSHHRTKQRIVIPGVFFLALLKPTAVPCAWSFVDFAQPSKPDQQVYNQQHHNQVPAEDRRLFQMRKVFFHPIFQPDPLEKQLKDQPAGKRCELLIFEA